MFNFNQTRHAFNVINCLLWASRFIDLEQWLATRPATFRKTKEQANILDIMEKMFVNDKQYTIPCIVPIKMSGAELKATVVLWLEKQSRKTVMEVIDANHRVMGLVIAKAVSGKELTEVVSILDDSKRTAEEIALVENVANEKFIPMILRDRLELVCKLYDNADKTKGLAAKLQRDGIVKNDHERILYSGAAELITGGYGVKIDDILLPEPLPRTAFADIKKSSNPLQAINDFRNKPKVTTDKLVSNKDFSTELKRFENGNKQNHPLYVILKSLHNIKALREMVLNALNSDVVPEAVTNK